MSNVKKWKNIVENAMKVIEHDMEDANHTDHEVSMAKSQLLSSVKSSVRIAKHIKDLSEQDGLEGWVASKLTMAEDYLQNVADYMDGQQVDEGYKVLPAMDKEKYQARDGLEGPFSTLSGKVVYYDPKEGSYYDPDTDMYISYEDFQKLDNDYTGMKTEEKGGSVARGRDESVKNIDNILVKMGADAPGDIIADIMHWIDAHPGEDLASLIKQGEGYYKDELNEVRTMPLDSIDWPDSNMLQTATDAIRHDYTKNDAFSHLYSMHGDDHGKWLRANEDDILAMFSQYSMDEGKIDEVIPKDTTYGVVVDGKYIAKGNKKNMRRLAKEKGGQLMNSPSKKVGDDTGKVNEGLEALTEQQFDEAAGEKDACYHKVKSRYKVWPSAYASGALVKCRKVGAKNWGNSDK